MSPVTVPNFLIDIIGLINSRGVSGMTVTPVRELRMGVGRAQGERGSNDCRHCYRRR